VLSEEELTELFDENTRLKRILWGSVAGVIALLFAAILLAHRPRTDGAADAAAIAEAREEKSVAKDSKKEEIESPPPARSHPRPRPRVVAKPEIPALPPVIAPPVTPLIETPPLVARPVPVTPLIQVTVHPRHRNPFRWMRKLWPFHRRHNKKVIQ